MNLSRRVRLRRAELGLSVRQAARQAGVDRSTWSQWEAGATVPMSRSQAGLERVLHWPPGTVAVMVADEEGYVDTATGEEYMDPAERALWDLRHDLGLRYVATFGEARAGELGCERARELIAYLRARTAMQPPPNPRPARVA